MSWSIDPLPSSVNPGLAARAHCVRVQPEGRAYATDEQCSLLEAALRAGIGLPASCRNGTCRACLCRLISGTVRHRIEWPGLSSEEWADGYILPCVAVALSDIVIELPNAARWP